MHLAILASTPFFLSACTPKRVVENIKPPAERLVCVDAGTRPPIPAEQTPDWPKIITVDQAKEAHLKYVASIREREIVIVRYLQDTEAKLFACSTNATWLRNWYAAQ